MPKKIILVISILLIFLLSYSNISFAQEGIRLMINDKLITEDLNYKIVNDNILIPLDIITDNLDLRTRFFSFIDTWQVESDDKVIKVRIGDRNLQVDDKVIEMPASTRMIDGQVMVPLEPIGEALGLIIRANPADNLVHILEGTAFLEEVAHLINEDYEGIKVRVSEEVKYDLSSSRDPYRIAFDLEETTIYKDIANIDLDSNLIKDVRISELSNSRSRVVLDLFSNLDYSIEELEEESENSFIVKVSPIIRDVDYSEDRVNIYPTSPIENFEVKYLTDPARVVIDIKNTAIDGSKNIEVDNQIIKNVRVSQYQTKPNNVVRAVLDLKDDIEVKVVNKGESLSIIPVRSSMVDINYDDERRELSFDLTEAVSPRVIPLEEGNRLIFDFPFTQKEVDKDLINLDNDFINSIRISQFSDNSTRVVLDMVGSHSYDLKWEGSTLLFRPDNRLSGIELKEREGGYSLNLSLSDQVNYGVYKLPNPERLVVDIFGAVLEGREFKGLGNIGFINSARVSQFTNDPKQVRVVLEMTDEVDFKVISEELSKDIEVSFDTKVRVEQKGETVDILEDKVIVIDPGHGGYDPGAIGFSGLFEKEVNLEISLMLKDLLEDSGATVMMTRKGDYFVELEDRAKMTDSIGPDIFISIHANSHPDRGFTGTESYVKPNTDNNSLLLANLTQSYLAEALGTIDRGVKYNNLYVLNHIDVPGILSEIAFLSNPGEEALLRKKSFREKSALALYKGIKDYFEYN